MRVLAGPAQLQLVPYAYSSGESIEDEGDGHAKHISPALLHKCCRLRGERTDVPDAAALVPRDGTTADNATHHAAPAAADKPEHAAPVRRATQLHDLGPAQRSCIGITSQGSDSPSAAHASDAAGSDSFGASASQPSPSSGEAAPTLSFWSQIAELPSLAALAATANGAAEHMCSIDALSSGNAPFEQHSSPINNHKLLISHVAAARFHAVEPAARAGGEGTSHEGKDEIGGSKPGPQNSAQAMQQSSAGPSNGAFASHDDGASTSTARGQSGAAGKREAMRKLPTKWSGLSCDMPSLNIADNHRLKDFSVASESPAGQNDIGHTGVGCSKLAYKPATRTNGTQRSRGSCQPVVGAQAGVTTGSWCRELGCMPAAESACAGDVVSTGAASALQRAVATSALASSRVSRWRHGPRCCDILDLGPWWPRFYHQACQ